MLAAVSPTSLFVAAVADAIAELIPPREVLPTAAELQRVAVLIAQARKEGR